MALQADKPKLINGSNETVDVDAVRNQGDFDPLGARMAAMEEGIVLCDMVLNDLIKIKQIVQEKGLQDAQFLEQKK